ncbi:MAG: hypothetical protein FJ225_10585 [Lentisphaerae bacterium]|nr:hypothetical protein [Lentisphaerota bacterium]
MRLLPREAWAYAVLLVILCAIGALAAWQTIAFAEDHIYPRDQIPIVAFLVWALTLGFMLIAGAFGLWASRFAAEAESRRRVARFVDSMDYLSDGLLVLDRRARITGANPAAEKLAVSGSGKPRMLREAFPCLSDDDVRALVDRRATNELERFAGYGDAPLTLRFRAYPTEDVTLLLISDVSAMMARRTHSRQVARLQLIGHIARGVARDFNNLLCGISGHASLLGRLRPGSPEMNDSIAAISRGADKGIALAGHLLELSRSRFTGMPAELVEQNVRLAVETIRYGLVPEWNVEYAVDEGLPAVALSRMQMEQVIVNLGLLAADALREPGRLRVEIRRAPSEGPLAAYAALALVSASGARPPVSGAGQTAKRPEDDSGVIESVIASLIEEAGGTLECLTAEDGSPIYRIALPRGVRLPDDEENKELADELKACFSGWSVLIAAPAKTYAELDGSLYEAGARAFRVDNVMEALARVEEMHGLDAMVLDGRLLGLQSRALLKAILKLRPEAAVVVLSDEAPTTVASLQGEVVVESPAAAPARIMAALVESKSLAAKRRA